MLQCTGAKRLDNKEPQEGHAWISLGRGSRIDFVGELVAGRDGNIGIRFGEGVKVK